MSNSLFVTSTEPYSGKSAVTLGLMDLLVRNARDVAFFRPVIADSPEKDRDINLILTQFNLNMKPEEAYACTLTEARELINARKRDELMIKILQKFKALCRTHDFVLCEGTDYEAPEIASEANFNLKIADALDSPLALLSSGLRRSLDSIRQSTLSTLDMLSTRQQELACIFVNRANLNETEVHGLQEELSAHAGGAPVYVIQENSVLSKPSIRDVKNALNAEIIAGGEYLDNVAEDYIIAAMQIGNFLNYITPGTLVVTPSDRVDIILASLGAKASKSCPEISGILLTGGLPLAPTIMNLTRGLQNMPMPILLAKDHTYKTIMDLTALHTTIKSDDKLKIDAALSEFARNVDGPALLDRILNRKSTRMTPLMFEFNLFEQARKHKMRSVLPEACEERILRAAEILLDRDVVELILIGDNEAVRNKIDRMGLRLDKVYV